MHAGAPLYRFPIASYLAERDNADRCVPRVNANVTIIFASYSFADKWMLRGWTTILVVNRVAAEIIKLRDF